MAPDVARKIAESEQKYFNLPAQHRSVFLEQLRSSEPDVAAALESRLAAARSSPSETVDHISRAGSAADLRTTEFHPDAPADIPECIGRYRIDGKLGEGGMGIVYRGRDADLNRFLAIKVVKESRQHDAHLCRRFLEEAQVMGRLQHPGIAPIHEIGTLGDGRPFFSMKQVQGKTLAGLLKERQDPAADLPRFVGIFEQVCQTLAYAQSQGIIHRDLKPANIMVGAFGEVQVMDWGLAKKIGTAEANSDASSPEAPATGASHVGTHAGVAMGTPAYMAPEQARGEIAELDERCDVFGLGAILCQILTGKPPFYSTNHSEMMSLARDGDLTDAFARLDGCSADAELIDVCKRCLAPSKADRPHHAGEVAEAVERYQEQVQERLRQAELRKRAAEVQAEEEVKRREVEQAKVREERKRRRVQLMLGGVVLILLVGVGAAALWYQDYLKRTAVAEREQEFARQKQVSQNIQDMSNFLAKYRQIHKDFDQRLRKKDGVFELQNRRQEWTEKLQLALATLSTRGKDFLARFKGTDHQVMAKRLADLRKCLREDQKDWQFAARLGEIRDRRMTWVGDEFDKKYALDNYPKAFGKAVVGFFEDDLKTVARRVRSMRIHDQVIASVYDWAWVSFLHELKTNGPKDKEQYRDLRGRLLRLVKLLDANPWSASLQDPSQWVELWNNQPALQELIASMPVHTSPHVFSLVGTLTKKNTPARKAWVKLASSRYVHEYSINYDIATMLMEGSASEAIGYFRAAVNIMPRNSATYTNWGFALKKMKRYDEAIAKFKKATSIDPNHANAYISWGNALQDLKRYDEAIAKFKKAISIEPNHANAYINWGNVLRKQKKHEEAIAKYKKATSIDPNDASAYTNWGAALANLTKYQEAIVMFKKATSFKPNHANAYSGWGAALADLKRYDKAIAKFTKAISFEPNHADAYTNWGNALNHLKKYEEAIVKYQEATSLEPDNALAYVNWGAALANLKKFEEAIAKYEKATSIEPNDANAYVNWGAALAQLKKDEKAIAKFKKAISLEPNHAVAYANWGKALYHLKKYDEATSPLKKAVQLQPKNPNPRFGLSLVLFEQGNFREAMASFYMLTQLVSPNHSFHRYAHTQMNQCQLWLAREKQLPAVLTGKTVSVQEQRALAILCARYKKRYRDAVTLYKDLFGREPKLAENLNYQDRYHAARAAALAAAGKGKAAAKTTDKERAELRQQALQWLRADHNAYAKLLKTQPQEAVLIQERLQHWQQDVDFKSVRAATPQAKLPESERKSWQQLWTDVAALQKQARSTYVESKLEGKLTDSNRQKVHIVQLKTGKTYVFDMFSKQFDTYLKLHDTKGTLLAENDDIDARKGNLNSRLTFTPKTTGNYRLLADSYKQIGRGSYEILIREFRSD